MRRSLALFAWLAGCATAGGDVDAIPGRDARSDGSITDGEFTIDSGTTGDGDPIETKGGSDSSSIFETESPCDPGLTECSFVCVDLKKDDKNCGACGKVCPAGEACSAGKCDLACAAPTTKCGGACVNTNNDEKNCGACGKTCGAGEVCKAGACEIVCSAPTTKCGTSCVNTSTDTSNCGSCGKACAVGDACTGGACIPPIVTSNFTFPSVSSILNGSCAGSLGAGGGGRCYVVGDGVTETFSRAASATKLTVSFRMSDYTSSFACYVGALSWSVLVNGTSVGTFSWVGGAGGDKSITQTYSFAPIASSGGSFTLRFQANNTVCSGGGSWNYYPGGSATLQ